MSCTAGSPSQKTLCFRTACLTGGYQRNSCCWPWLAGPKWALVPKLLEKVCGGEVAWACDQHESCLRELLEGWSRMGWLMSGGPGRCPVLPHCGVWHGSGKPVGKSFYCFPLTCWTLLARWIICNKGCDPLLEAFLLCSTDAEQPGACLLCPALTKVLFSERSW